MRNNVRLLITIQQSAIEAVVDLVAELQSIPLYPNPHLLKQICRSSRIFWHVQIESLRWLSILKQTQESEISKKDSMSVPNFGSVPP